MTQGCSEREATLFSK